MKTITIAIIIFICNNLIYSQDKKITLAVLDFENNSIIDNEKLEPLRNGIPSILISKLANIETITFVERERLNDILNELSLGQNAAIDPSTAQKIGRLLGAQTLILGSFMNSPGDKMRVDLRIVETETGLTLRAEEVTGDSEDLFDIIADLAEKVTDELSIEISSEESGIGFSIEK